MTPAIVADASAVGLGVIRALGERGVPVIVVRYDEEDIGHLSRHVAEVVPAPHPDLHPDGFVEAISGLGRRYPRSPLIPGSDAALVAISRSKQELAEDFVVSCPDREVVDLFIDKRSTHALAEEVGVDAPRTVPSHSLDEALGAASVIGFPCLVKPAHGHIFKRRLGTKMLLVMNEEALAEAYLRAENAGLQVMIQEIVPGPDSNGVNYNAYIVDGQVVAEFTSRKVRNAPPQYGSPRVAVSEDIPEVADPSLRLLMAAGYTGFANVEFKWDERIQSYRLMEVNARHNLSSLLAVRCGIDFPWLEYDHLINGIVLRRDAETVEAGMYWIDLTRDIASNLRYARSERFSLREYVRPYRSRRVFAVWKANDPRPLLWRLLLLIRRAFRQLRARLAADSGR